MTISTFEAAKKVCELSNWSVTNLKLQKILYIAHKVFLGRNNGQPLIDNNFEAWDYGPVVPELYREVKMFGNQPIKNIFRGVEDIDGSTESALIQEACEHLLAKSAGELVAITHRDDGAWDRCYQPGVKGIVISNEQILDEYVRTSRQ
jgi:uncharacterized phage-associated protein